MIQDIAPHTYHNEYKPSAPDKNSFILAYEKGSILLPHQEREADIYFPRFQDLEEKVSDLYSKYIYLFSIDDQRFYLIPELDTTLLPDYEFQDIRNLRTARATASGICRSYRTSAFPVVQQAPVLRLLWKTNAAQPKRTYDGMPFLQQSEYPVLCPAVIVGITNGDKIILSKYEGRRFKRYALIAGFAEIGETIEETVHREVMEEVGLKVKNLRYYKSQPWSFSGTLLFGFFCDVDGDDTLTVDHEELSMAQWVERDKIPDQGNNISLTKEMMMLFRDGKEPR